MADLLSPGVKIEEIDRSTIVPSVAATTAIFCGNFTKGPVDMYSFISSVQDLKDIYGLPTKENFNEWYQAYNFLQYGNKLYIARTCDLNGTLKETTQTFASKDSKLKDYDVTYDITFKEVDQVDSKKVVFTKVGKLLPAVDDEVFVKGSPTKFKVTKVEDSTDTISVIFKTAPTGFDISSVYQKTIKAKTFTPGTKLVSFKGANSFKIGDIFAFGNEITEKQYKVLSIDEQLIDAVNYTVIKYINTEDDEFEVPATILEDTKVYKLLKSQNSTVEIPGTSDSAVYDEELYDTLPHTVRNFSTFEVEQNSLGFVNPGAKLKIFARNPGIWGDSVDVAIANSTDFNKNKIVKNGISLDDLFEYIPEPKDLAIIVLYKNEIVEQYIVSLDENKRDSNNKSMYIENVINTKSNYIFVNVNKACADELPKSCLDTTLAKLTKGSESVPGRDDIIAAYELFANKEEIEIDVVIANENYQQAAANLAETRQDCVAVLCCPYEASVGLKASVAMQKNIDFRKDLNINSSYSILVSNYKYQYLPEMDTYKWVSLCGDIAGVIVKTTEDRESWYAPAGLNRGLVRNVTKLAANYTAAMRDQLYRNNINPVVSFPNQGVVIWGQKTLLDKESSFNRINVRRLFIHLERALAKMAKYSLFEFNDSFTRNYIISVIKPFLGSVKAGRGIQDYLCLCDESNNTPDVISRNKLIVDIYIKPTYVAEFIHLRFTNAGTKSFSEIIQ
nr:MAG TPA: tail sheath protein [Caudoviricetes sp.]